MTDALEILFVAFCGVVLTFALIFVACWCVISCSFFCFKYFYCGKLRSMISVISLNSSSSTFGDDEGMSERSSSQESLDEDSIAVESYEGVSHSHHRGGSSSTRGNHSHESRSPTNPSQEGYFVENVSETGSSSAETGKVLKEDKPPLYDFPPAYESLFPSKDKSLQEVTFVNEAIGTLPSYVPTSSSNNSNSTANNVDITASELSSKSPLVTIVPNAESRSNTGSSSCTNTNSHNFTNQKLTDCENV